MSDIFDVLADGTRRELLRTLRERAGEVSVGQLVEQLGISQPTVSKHLKVLRDHALVTVREEGQHRYYRLDAEPLVEVETWLAPFAAAALTPGPDGAATIVEGDPVGPWPGAEVGGRVGRAAAETAHQARVAFEAAQEKLQGAQKRLGERLPSRRRSR